MWPDWGGWWLNDRHFGDAKSRQFALADRVCLQGVESRFSGDLQGTGGNGYVGDVDEAAGRSPGNAYNTCNPLQSEFFKRFTSVEGPVGAKKAAHGTTDDSPTAQQQQAAANEPSAARNDEVLVPARRGVAASLDRTSGTPTFAMSYRYEPWGSPDVGVFQLKVRERDDKRQQLGEQQSAVCFVLAYVCGCGC